MIPREEWLQDAQALPVGRSERVYHGAEHRQNMLVTNNMTDGRAGVSVAKMAGLYLRSMYDFRNLMSLMYQLRCVLRCVLNCMCHRIL